MRKPKLSPNEHARINSRITALSKQLHAWPSPLVPPMNVITPIVGELRAIMRLNMEQGYGPISLFDRANKWEQRAANIMARVQEHERALREGRRSFYRPVEA